MPRSRHHITAPSRRPTRAPRRCLSERTFLFFVALLVPLAATGSVPGRVNFQGLLLDDGGSPVTDTVNLDFALFAAASGGSAVWTESHTGVEVTDGIYQVELGATTPLTPELLAPGTLYLEVGVAGEVMTPRVQLLAVPFALRAAKAESVDPPLFLELLPPARGGTATAHQVGLAIRTASGPIATRPLAMCNDVFDDCGWFQQAGALHTPEYLIADGSVSSTYNEATGALTISNFGNLLTTPDPDASVGGVAHMIGAGADVNVAILSRANETAVIGARPTHHYIATRRDPAANTYDFVFGIERDGHLWWGDPDGAGANGYATSRDVELRRVEQGAFEYPQFTADIDGTPVVMALRNSVVQGTGATTHGSMHWGDGSDGFDTGTEVCAGATPEGLSCVTTHTPIGANQACAFDHGDVGTYFHALCR